jgi:hypothetical protein
MKKFASYSITKYIFPGKAPVYDLEVKNTANQKAPYRLYNGTSFPELLGVVANYGLCVDAEHMKTYEFGEDGKLVKLPLDKSL